ncbi:hypothetical protein PVAR5_6396 [Paecilomyces variotii No. 5]|uniref:Uncharacterized protein n=1 Tax=Byssochlamys spectabilis (strain No. 5 / NBRC 109023) TaxID=1356009 RepID=V5G6T5_BYSSN|nr:hypothetical protein PVAR5_6396 [Paecilomyces variotii No. 5]
MNISSSMVNLQTDWTEDTGRTSSHQDDGRRVKRQRTRRKEQAGRVGEGAWGLSPVRRAAAPQPSSQQVSSLIATARTLLALELVRNSNDGHGQAPASGIAGHLLSIRVRPAIALKRLCVGPVRAPAVPASHARRFLHESRKNTKQGHDR